MSNVKAHRSHYIADLFWDREPRSLTGDQLNQYYGWKTLLLLPFQSQFQLVIVCGTLICCVISLRDIGFALSSRGQFIPIFSGKIVSIMNIFDVLYALDIFLTAIFKNISWVEVKYLHKSRNGFVVLLEFLSLLPFEIMTDPQNDSYYLIRSRYLVRIIRLAYAFQEKNQICENKSTILKFLKLAVILILASVVTCCIFVIIYTNVEDIEITLQLFFAILTLTTARVTNKGFGEVESISAHLDKYEFTCLLLINIIAFVIVSYHTCQFACLEIPKIQYRSDFAHKYMNIKNKILKWKILNAHNWRNYHMVFERTLNNYFELTWNHVTVKRHKFVPGYRLPEILLKDIALDTSWDAFKHSHLFANESVPFLRATSVYMEHSVFYPGEILIKKDKMKSAMIYVVSGIIQVLSEENSETPVMSLTGGSCIGETSLFIDYRSTYTVVCKTLCEVCVLKRKRFLQVCRVYPNIFKQIHRTVDRRYFKARKYLRIFEMQKEYYQAQEETDFLAMLYVRSALKRFLGSNTTLTREEAKLADKIKDYVFCADYLNLLTLPEETELVSDSVFIRKTFPFVFQPDSIVLQMWNVFVGLVVFGLVCVYPIALCTIAGEDFTYHILLYILGISAIWIVDIYICLSTAVKTRDAFYTKIKDIIYYRFGTLSFLVDILCVIPIGPVMYVIDTHIESNLILLLEIHKLMKIYRISGVISNFKALNSSRLVLVKYLRIGMCLFMLFYYTACLLYLLLCHNGCPAKFIYDIYDYYEILSDDVTGIFIYLYTQASYFINDATIYPILEVINYQYYMVVVFMQVVYCCVFVYAQAGIIATEVVNRQEKYEFKEFASNVEVLMRKIQFPIEAQKKISEYLRSQHYLDQGVSFLQSDVLSLTMSKNLSILYKYVLFSKYLYDVPIFKAADDDFLMDVCRSVSVHDYLAGDTISYAGEVCKQMHLIIFGHCKVIYRNGKTKFIGPKDSVSVMELCLKIPIINTVVTYTDCKILSLWSKEYHKLLSRYPHVKSFIKESIRDAIPRGKIKLLLAEPVYTDYARKAIKSRPMFKIFRYTKKKSDNLDYHLGFTKVFVIFKFFLMRVTIIPDGKFLITWEILRCILAFATNILSSLGPLFQYDLFRYILLSLDCAALLDIYVMHHVCYYNSKGLLISHPMSTAKYYWSHRFIIDLLGCIPFDYSFKEFSYILYFRMNRLLQIHRIIALIRHFDASVLSKKAIFDVLKYLPLTILLVNYASSLVLVSTCDFTTEKTKEFVCAAEYLVLRRMPNKTFNFLNAQCATLLWTVSALAMINTAKLRFTLPIEMIMLGCLALIGAAFSLWLTAKMVANNFYRNSDLTSYQQAMRDLIQFYSFRKIDKAIKRQIINHFEYMWVKKSGKNINVIMSHFNICFKEDALFSKFGIHLEATSVFFNAEKSFFRSLLIEMDHKVMLKRGYVYRVNDICSDIYFLLNGEVEVLGPDYNKLVVLAAGSLFGNLGKQKYVRQTVMMVAKSNLELLIIPSTTFHDILSNYTALHEYFKRITMINIDYIENEFSIDKKGSMHNLYKRRFTLFALYSRYSPLLRHYKYIKIAQFCILLLSCFVGFHYESLEKAILSTSNWTMCILYLLDVLFLIRIYLKFHTRYVDEYGAIIDDKWKIIMKYFNGSPGFCFDLFTIIPFDLISFAFTYSPYFPIIFHCLRLNRLLRVILVIQVLAQAQEKLHINVAAIRLLYILTCGSVYAQFMGLAFFYSRITTDTVDASRLYFYKTSIFMVMYTMIGASVCTFFYRLTHLITFMSVLITILGRFIITLFIAELCATLDSIRKSQNIYKQFAMHNSNFMVMCDVSIPLQKEIHEYLELLWSNYSGVLNPDLLNRAPYYLREATLNSMFGYHLRNHLILKKFHVDLIRQMAARLRVLIFFPGNHVVYKGDVDQCMYFIHDGIVDALTEDSLSTETVAITLVSGDSFGLEQGLFASVAHKYTYKVRRPSVLIVLHRLHWMHMLHFFPASVEILQMNYQQPLEDYDENIKNYLT